MMSRIQTEEEIMPFAPFAYSIMKEMISSFSTFVFGRSGKMVAFIASTPLMSPMMNCETERR